MLYTRNGDEGTSGLFGSKERVPKDSVLFEALGSLDELNCLLGLCYANSREALPYNISVLVRTVQQHLFILQAALAGAQKSIAKGHLEWMEEMVAHLEEHIPEPHAFTVPGESKLGALFDYTRAVARRAERAVIHAKSARELSPENYAYLNRLSSLLYALARFDAAHEGAREASPTYL